MEITRNINRKFTVIVTDEEASLIAGSLLSNSVKLRELQDPRYADLADELEALGRKLATGVLG